MEEKSTRRPSPRWKEPLVEEFHPPPSVDGRRPGQHENGREWRPPPSTNGTTTTTGTKDPGTWTWSEKREREREEEEQRKRRGGHLLDEEEPFFSEEFYQAFPHLRPSSSTIRRFVPPSSRAASTLLTEEPEFSTYLDRFDRNWRTDPFWRDLYPRWAEPIFKDGIDVKTNIVNDSNRFAVDIDTYQFRPEELQVKTLDDTLVIEGRHEDVRDRDNYTKMYFVRKYQLPSDVEPQSISSHVDSRGHLTVEARKLYPAIEGRERSIPIESPSGRRFASRSSSYSPRDRFYDSGRGSANDYYRTESRAGGDYLSPKSNGYRTEFESRKTDDNGMRHEARREEFREQVRHTGSAANVLPPPSPVPVYRTSSRLSAADGGLQSESRFHRTSSQSRNYREYSSNGGSEHLLRPAEELGGRSSLFGRSVPIQRA